MAENGTPELGDLRLGNAGVAASREDTTLTIYGFTLAPGDILRVTRTGEMMRVVGRVPDGWQVQRGVQSDPVPIQAGDEIFLVGNVAQVA